jgi:hypothetical protein
LKTPNPFFACFLAGVFSAAGVTLGAFFLNFGVPTKSSTFVVETIRFKRNLAESIPAPKILVMGGSGALFGISAAKLEQGTGTRAINLASHAGLGLPILLDSWRSLAVSGDVVLLALEYELYRGGKFSDSLGELGVDYILAGDPGLLRRISVIEAAWVFFLTPDSRLFRGIKNRFLRREGRGVTGRYNPDMLDRWGDLADPQDPVSQDFPPIANRSCLAQPWSADSSGSEALKEFILALKKSNVKVVAAFPNLMDTPAYRSPVAFKNVEIVKKIYSNLEVPLLDTFDESLFPREDFLDTEYHLKRSARFQRTEKLILPLRNLLDMNGGPR